MSFPVKRLATFLAFLLVLFAMVPFVLADQDILDDEIPEIEPLTLYDQAKLRSNQHTQIDDLREIESFLTIPDNFELITSSDQYRLYAELENFAIRVEHIDSGFIYGSSQRNKFSSTPNMNTTFTGYMNSLVVLEYFTYNALTGNYVVSTEGFFTSSETTVNYSLESNGFTANYYYGASQIRFTVRVWLEETSLHVSIDNDSIQEVGSGWLHRLMIYPYFGAVLNDSIPGYMIVPEGSGALVRYRPLNTITEAYSFNYYGSDSSIFNELKDDPALSLPLFGMIHGINQHGFLGIIESGASNAVLMVNPSRQNLRYHYTSPIFVFRHLYNSPISQADAQGGQGRVVIQEEMYSTDIHVQYHFLEEEQANYVGMARTYQAYLLENHHITPHLDQQDDVSMLIELIGSERKEGFIFDQMVRMTTIEQAESIIDAIHEDIPFLQVVYKGIFQGGMSQADLFGRRIEPSLGTKTQLQQLLDKYDSTDVNIALYHDVMKRYATQSLNQYREAAQRVTKRILSIPEFTMQSTFIRPTRIQEVFEVLSRQLLQDGFDSLVLGTIGSRLYSEYSSDMVDRYEAVSIYRAMLEDSDLTIGLIRPNAYLWSSLAYYIASPISNKQYAIYTDTIPFLQLVLSGIMNQYAPFMNFASNTEETLLRMMDYNVYPAYVLSHTSAYALNKTELQSIYTSSYETWKERIGQDYLLVQSVLQPVVGVRVRSREVLDYGFVKTTYENNVVIYVNYTNNTKLDSTSGLTLPMRSARVVRP